MSRDDIMETIATIILLVLFGLAIWVAGFFHGFMLG